MDTTGRLEGSQTSLEEAIERVELARADLLHVVGTRHLRAALGESKEDLQRLLREVHQIAHLPAGFDDDARYELTAAGEAVLDAIAQREVS